MDWAVTVVILAGVVVLGQLHLRIKHLEARLLAQEAILNALTVPRKAVLPMPPASVQPHKPPRSRSPLRKAYEDPDVIPDSDA